MVDITCNNCGESDWNELTSDEYPERRRSRDRTVRTVYECRSCGEQGRHFEHQNHGTEQMTGVMR